MVRLLRAVPVPLVLIVLIGLSGVVLGRIYAGPMLTHLVFGAAVGSVVVGVAARRAPSWLVAPLSVLALSGYAAGGVWLAARHADVPDPLGTVLVDAAGNGIPRLLTAMIPVEPSPDTVLLPLVAAWLAGLASTEIAVRAGRVLTGYLPPVLLYAAALYVVGPNAGRAVWPSVGFAVAAVVGLAAGGRSDPDEGHRQVPAAIRARLMASTATGIAAVVALAAFGAPLVADRVHRTPADPRRHVHPPVVDSLDESPLIRVSGWALNPGQPLFDVHTTHDADPVVARAAEEPPAAGADTPDEDTAGDDAQPAGYRIRLAVLTDYDGVTWRVGATYRNAGRVLPPAAPRPGAVVDTVRQEITIAQLTGRLLPAVPTPQEVTGARVAYDPDTGTLIHPDGLTPGLRYTVTSVRERPDLNLLTTSDVPSGDGVARVLRLGEGVPEQMQRLSEELAADNGAPYERAIAIEQFLAEHYRLVADAPSGHAYPNLSFFLFGPRHAGGQRGTSEQFAAAFAVLGRMMGLPTRVVVGFRSDTGSGTVRGADAYAWPEVLFDDLGWVPFDPLPRPDTEPRPVEDDFKPKPQESTPPPSPTPPPTAAPASTEPPAVAAPQHRDGDLTPAVAAGGVGLLLVTVAGFVLVLLWLRHTRTRRRLGAGGPTQRVTGAWHETLDALRLAGHPPGDELAATEVAAYAARVAAGLRAPVPPVDELAALVNLAAFAPGGVSEEQARTATAQAAAYTAALRANQPWWRRVLWSLHPGPLRWRR